MCCCVLKTTIIDHFPIYLVLCAIYNTKTRMYNLCIEYCGVCATIFEVRTTNDDVDSIQRKLE